MGFLSENASVLLTAGGVVGTVATAVLTGRAAVQATYKIGEETAKRVDEFERANNRPVENSGEIEALTKWEKTTLTAVYFIPPVLLGGATIASIVMANRVSAKNAAALAAAYGLS